MSIVKITGEGLASIAVLVVLLWGCIALEHSMLQRSRRETARLLMDLKRMKNTGGTEPVMHPLQRPSASRPVSS